MQLTEQQLREINDLRASGWKLSEIAKDLELDEGEMRRSYMAWRKGLVKEGKAE